MSDEGYSGGPLDTVVLEELGQRASTHPLVDEWSLQPDTISPRRLELLLDEGQYPPSVEAARLDIRWFVSGDYTVHYLETQGEEVWQCRWDRHPKPGESTAHFHPPPDAGSDIEPSTIQATPHHLSVLFDVLDWITDRLVQLHEP